MSEDLRILEDALGKAAASNNVEAARAITADMHRILRRSLPNGGLPDPVKLGQENMPQSIRDVAGQAGVASQRLAGIGSAPVRAGLGVAGVFGADVKTPAENWKALGSATPDTIGGQIAGNAMMFGAAPVRSAGPMLTMAAERAPWWKPAAAVMGSRPGQVADMMGTQGALNAVTEPGDVGERGMAGLWGMTGAVAPASVGVMQSGRRVMTKGGSQLRLAEALRDELGGDIEPLANALHGSYPGSTYGVRPSAAMLTRNPQLEVLETGSRVRTPDQWTNFDRANAAQRWESLNQRAGTPEELASLKTTRDKLTGSLRNEALSAGEGTFWPYQLDPIDKKLTELATGAHRPNRDVQTMVAYVRGEIDKGVSPEQLYNIRKQLTDGLKAGPTSELSQAARAARPQRMEIISEIDKSLNELSGGKWQAYLDAYKGASPNINSKQALQNIVGELKYGRPSGEVPVSMGERPAPYTVGKLSERFGNKEFGSKVIDQLTPADRQFLETVLGDLHAQQGVMLPRGTLGSPTAPLLANAGRVGGVTNGAIDTGVGSIPLVGSHLAASLKGSLGRKAEEGLVEMMQNPKVLANELRKAQLAQALLQNAGRTGSATGAGIRTAKE